MLLFYLPGTLGRDPAGCDTYPCVKEIHSAVTSSSNLAEFTQLDGARIEETITSGVLSDPDLLRMKDGRYLLLVSAGQSSNAYHANNTDDLFESLSGTGEPYDIASGAGGVPSAVETDRGELFIYVTTNFRGHEQIRLGVTDTSMVAVPADEFEVVVDGSLIEGDASVSVSSPSVIHWGD
ncbi:MAG: hypothetical protein HQL46_10485 [Gammaproteobacteria bacterium]|nr:hypothetical protein [Gammaproteobacteria bacterium]